MDTITERMMLIIKEKTSERRRWKEMEEFTGIAATTWQNLGRRKQRALADMVEAVGKAWPEHAFWLITGLTDPSYGHVGANESCGYPKPGAALETTNRYFQSALEARALAREAVMAWWLEELGEELGGMAAAELINDQLLRSAGSILRRNEGEDSDVRVAKFNAAMRKISLANSLRKAELLLDTERDLDYEKTEQLVLNVEAILSSISETARLEKIDVDFDVMNSRLLKLKEMIARHKRINQFVDELRKENSGSKEK